MVQSSVTVKWKNVDDGKYLDNVTSDNNNLNLSKHTTAQDTLTHSKVYELHPSPVCIQHHPRVGGELAPAPWRLGIEIQVMVFLSNCLNPEMQIVM